MNIVNSILKILKKILKKDIFSESKKIVAYITSSEALPMALSDEEEEFFLKKLSQGDEEAKNMLIEHNLRLVVYISKKFENTGLELEDLISVGAIGLIKAVQSFNYEKNIKLATYASRCIENEILMFIRKKSRQSNEISLDEPLNYDKDGNELLLSDVIEYDGESASKEMERTSEKKILWEAIKKLNSREQRIMELRFGLLNDEENTQKEVADMLGISQSYISRIEKKILVRLKKDLAKTDIN